MPVRIFQGAHRDKFKVGLQFLPKTRSRGLGLSVTVIQNTSLAHRSFHDPYSSKGVVSVPAGLTGTFDDVTPGSGIEPSHDLRLRLLYVDFDGANWWEPETELKNLEISAKTSISLEDLREAIEELLSVL